MTNPSKDQIPSGRPVSETSVRSVLRGRRRARASRGAQPPSGGVRSSGTDEPATASADRAVPLRRWSVAELIARAVAAHPADRLSHGY